MYFENRKANYDKSPMIAIDGFKDNAVRGYDKILLTLHKTIRKSNKKKIVIVIDYYHGVRKEELETSLINKIGAKKIIYSEDAKLPEHIIRKKLDRNITEDRVFGVLSVHKLSEFYDENLLNVLKDSIDKVDHGVVIVYGIGAALITKGDILIYGDMARWEIQQRLRSKELDNWGAGNFNEDILRKYKRAYFIEWRVLDRHKRSLFDDIDYVIDTNRKDDPKMITGNAFRGALDQAAKKPFRLVPYFDEGIWGGKWMEEVCDLRRTNNNFAWCFDGVPEENSVYLKIDEVVVEIPAINIVFRRPKELLGPNVHSRFGHEFPIRFDFLDTMEGGNLSLQVHPLTGYIQENFGMHYTQDESYYILDAKEDACVYLGIKDGVNKDILIPALEKAQRKGETFDDSKYINKFSIKKHDHILIPAGTIHCSGKNAMVLEISATPYIFTMKLWDWDRVGLDGKPRPVHIEHGKNVIQYDRDTKWVQDNLLHRVDLIKEEEGIREERTGLHELEFIETRRHWFDKAVEHNTDGSVNMLNLIEGEEAVVTSPTGKFEPFVIHYAETFIIPSCVGEYTIAPFGKSKGKKIATIKAYVRI